MSEILSKRYDFLDAAAAANNLPLDSKRRRTEHWQELEQALFEWIDGTEGKISGETIRDQARFLWRNLPVYKDKEEPEFSNGWLYGFQRRQAQRRALQNGEADSVLVEQAVEHMAEIHGVEEEKDDVEKLYEQILEQVTGGDEVEEMEEHEEALVIEQEVPKVSASEALESLRMLRLYEEQQDRAGQAVLAWLNKYERVLQARVRSQQRQRDIRSYFLYQ